MAASTSGGAEPQQVRRWRPLRDLGKVWFNERCAVRSKGTFGPVAIGCPFPRRDNGQHAEGREAPSTIRCIETI